MQGYNDKVTDLSGATLTYNDFWGRDDLRPALPNANGHLAPGCALPQQPRPAAAGLMAEG